MTNKTTFSTAIHFNHSNRTIEITKKFDKASSCFGTDEFYALKDAVAFAPAYRVVVKTTKCGDRLKGLTYDFMKRYIEKHDDAEMSIMAQFNDLTGESNDEFEFESYSYGEIKTWFLAQYPEIEKRFAKNDLLIADAKRKRLAAKAA